MDEFWNLVKGIEKKVHDNEEGCAYGGITINFYIGNICFIHEKKGVIHFNFNCCINVRSLGLCTRKFRNRKENRFI